MLKRSLIVDDELTILTGLSKALHELCGFRGAVRTVVNGREAIYEASLCFYDICFLDIRLPDINGLEVMRDIKEISPETKIIFMSASYTLDDLKMLVANGEAFYIYKPFNFSQIKYVMDLALADNNLYKKQASLESTRIKDKSGIKKRSLSKTLI
jgi:DNA-binding NtrC family response regulator